MGYKLKKIYVGDKLVRPKWIPSTITGSTVFSTKASFSEGSDTQGIYVSPDGTKLYVAFWSNKRLYQYNMTTPFDASTATAVRYITLTTPDGIYFDSTGRYMFTGTETGNKILRYTLSTAWDISTATQDQELYAGTRFPTDISLSLDGKHIYYCLDLDKLYSYDLSTAFDLTTATNQKNLSFGNAPLGIYVRNDGRYLYIRGQRSYDNVWQYQLETPYDITSNRTQIGIINGIWGDCRNFWVSNDCKYWAIDYGSVDTGQGIRMYQAVKTN